MPKPITCNVYTRDELKAMRTTGDTIAYLILTETATPRPDCSISVFDPRSDTFTTYNELPDAMRNAERMQSFALIDCGDHTYIVLAFSNHYVSGE